MWNARLDDVQAGIKIARRNINNFRYCRWHPPYGRKQRTKGPLNESERREWKNWLKTQHSENENHGIQSITSWQRDGEIMETVRDFILGGSKITADGDCSHEIKRPLLLGRKAMTNLDSMLKSRGVTLPIQSFSSSHVRMWELDYEESWASKNWCFRTGVGEDSWESLGLQDQTSQW